MSSPRLYEQKYNKVNIFLLVLQQKETHCLFLQASSKLSEDIINKGVPRKCMHVYSINKVDISNS